MKRYGVEISENIYVEEDKDKHCREYPNEQYESFGDCDHKYLKMVCKKHDIYPIWLTNNFTNTTTRFVLSDEEQSWLALSGGDSLHKKGVRNRISMTFFNHNSNL